MGYRYQLANNPHFHRELWTQNKKTSPDISKGLRTKQVR